MAKIMGIDYGDARVGIAFSDMTGFLVGETLTLHEKNFDRVVETLVSYAKEKQVSEIVLGYPKNMNGTIGVRGEKSEALAALLKERTSLTVTLWDERSTTVSAHQILNEHNIRGKKRKNTVDAVAASLILQSFLDYKNR